MTLEAINPVSAGQALQSMRDSDFDCYSAYAEAIDNSIQANATEIHIVFKTEKKTKGHYENITRVAFVDNGDGMAEKVIHNCLVLGYSSRYNDRSGIGRFGVGMTMGAIHECCLVSVYSRKELSQPWLKASLDISSSEESSVLIAPPEETKFPDWLESIEPKKSGTAVVWERYDRQVENGTKIINESKIYFGRVFRKYIWKGVSIFVNGEPLYAVDPLYVTTEKTKFPNDMPATLASPITLPWLVPAELATEPGQTENITINLSLLPSDIRGNRGTGNRLDVTNRHIDRNQGISITRKGREVAYGAVPYWPGDKSWFDQIDRWWGCEIEFSPLLDRAFQVKNIKRGAVPVYELKKAIFDKINPTVKSYLESIRAQWDENDELANREKEDSGEHDTGHGPAEGIAKEKNYEKTPIHVEDPEAAEQALLDKLNADGDETREQALRNLWKSQPYSIEETTWRGNEFIELNPLGGQDVLLYNMSHPLMKKIKEITGKIELNSDDDSKVLAKQLRCVVDLLLLSYVKGESKFDKKEDIEILEILRLNWGMYANTYIKAMDNSE